MSDDPSKLDQLIKDYKLSADVPLTDEEMQVQQSFYENLITKRGEDITGLETLSEVPLTPEELQAQQDLYDQMQAPTTETVDFVAERDAYLDRHKIDIQNAVLGEDEQGNIIVTGDIDIEPYPGDELSLGFEEPKLF